MTAPSRDATPKRSERPRLGLAEWGVMAGLLVASLPGPWLTIGLPTALAFAFHDRRPAARAVGSVLLVASALIGLAATGGPVLLAMAVGASALATAWVALGRPGSLDALAAPALAGAGAGWGLGRLAAPAAAAAWDALLGEAVADAGQSALARYRALGLDAETIATLERALDAAALWTVRLWPALAALALWLGVWLGGRILASWGRPAPRLARRLARRPLAMFAVGVPAAWLLILALAGFWVPVAGVERIAANAALIALVLFALDGAALVGWWLDRRGASTVLRIVAAVLAVVFALPVAAAGLIAIGLADVWIRFRDRPRAGRAVGRRHR